jgi:hypothetical protein
VRSAAAVPPSRTALTPGVPPLRGEAGFHPRREVTIWRRVFAGGAVTAMGLALWSAAPLATAACEDHACDTHTSVRGCASADVDPSDPCCEQGFMLDENNWESTLPNADWLPFNTYETITFDIAAWTGKREPNIGLSKIIIAPAPPEGPAAPYPDVYQETDGPLDVTTLGSGNEAEWGVFGPGQVSVMNATCSPTLVYVVISFPEIEGGVPSEFIGPCQRHAR